MRPRGASFACAEAAFHFGARAIAANHRMRDADLRVQSAGRAAIIDYLESIQEKPAFPSGEPE